jgi:FAD:protein FMN transferase
MSQIAWRSFAALGTTAWLFVTQASGLDRARRVLEEELAAIDLACSRFRPDSELSRLNRAEGHPVRASALFVEAVSVALGAARATDGILDPTIGRALRAIGYDRDFAAIAEASDRPVRVRAAVVEGWPAVRLDRRTRIVQLPRGVELDLGATAKALAADRAARRAHDSVGGGVLVNLGGDLSIAGEAPPGGWLVQVTDDHAARAPGFGQTVRVFSGGLATSSTTVRRWSTRDGPVHHIVDPETGDSAAEVWRTVSVAAGSCLDANVASTAAIVRGESAPDWLDALGLPSRLVGREGRVVRVAEWPEEAFA